MLERKYQAELIKVLRRRFPDCVILKNDSSYMQGVPDLILLWHDKWAMLEVKASADAPEQPNQRATVDSAAREHLRWPLPQALPICRAIGGSSLGRPACSCCHS